MLHHMSLPVADIVAAGAFYDGALSALGFRRVGQVEGFIGYGLVDGQDKFALKSTDRPVHPPSAGFHVAFSASSAAQVDEFYRQAIRLGGRDNGAPGYRPDFGDTYYAAFIFDLDGYRIEAVCNGLGET